MRDLLDAGINVLAHLVAATQENGATQLSLSCNPDLTLDLVPRLREAEGRGEKVAPLAQVNRNLPFMYGDTAAISHAASRSAAPTTSTVATPDRHECLAFSLSFCYLFPIVYLRSLLHRAYTGRS